MTLVPDTWGANLNPASKTFKIAKVFSVVAVTPGIPIAITENFFLKDCPFPVEVINVQGIMRTIAITNHDGAGGDVSMIVQSSQEIDSSPSAPASPVWNDLVSSVDCSAISPDSVCFDAPNDGTNTLDQTYVAIPEGGSVRATLSAQVEDIYIGAGTSVQILVILECRPTDGKDRRFF